MTHTGEWKLGHRPALDGLRGLAIAMVLACHTLIAPIGVYGGTGVDLFFVLSGFLITSLLIEERRRDGTVSLRGFYVRRARRLLPALVVYVAVITLVRVVTWGDPATAFLAAAAVLGYVANWAMVAGLNVGYFGQCWSLAIEEQFYLLWPVVAIALMRRGGRTLRIAACVSGVVLMCAWRAIEYRGGLDETTTGRAAPLLIGCATAFYLDGRQEGRSHPRLAAAMLVLLLTTPFLPHPIALDHLGAGLLAAGIILCCARGAGVRWLEWKPLALLGRRSYGLYLWHYLPMIAVMSLPIAGLPRLLACIAALAASWLLTHVSWRFVEAPFTKAAKASDVHGTRRAGVHVHNEGAGRGGVGDAGGGVLGVVPDFNGVR